jgi:hypothetical protein
VRRFAAKSSPALIYVNSIASAHVIELLEPKAPVLTHVHGVRAERVETVHAAIPFDAVRAERTGQVFQELRLPADALLVAASGIPCWRKGADITPGRRTTRKGNLESS